MIVFVSFILFGSLSLRIHVLLQFWDILQHCSFWYCLPSPFFWNSCVRHLEHLNLSPMSLSFSFTLFISLSLYYIEVILRSVSQLHNLLFSSCHSALEGDRQLDFIFHFCHLYLALLITLCSWFLFTLPFYIALRILNIHLIAPVTFSLRLWNLDLFYLSSCLW